VAQSWRCSNSGSMRSLNSLSSPLLLTLTLDKMIHFVESEWQGSGVVFQARAAISDFRPPQSR
jgi:hypothetical protein